MAGSWTTQTAIINSTASLTTSWQKFTATATSAATARQFAILFQGSLTGTAGTNDYFEVTGVQLETGSVATPFERRPYGTELMLCQRYFQPIKAITGTSGGTTTIVNANVQYSEMRATPTYAVTGALVFTDPYVASYTQSSGNVSVAGHSTPLGALS